MKTYKEFMTETVKSVKFHSIDGEHTINFWKSSGKSGVDIFTQDDQPVNVSASSIVANSKISHDEAKDIIDNLKSVWETKGDNQTLKQLEKITMKKWKR